MKTYKLTKEEYDELQELLSWWRKKKQKKINKKIKAGKSLPHIEPYNCLETQEYKAISHILPFGITTDRRS